MKHLKWLAIVLLLLGTAMSATAWADRGSRQHQQHSFGQHQFRGDHHFRGDRHFHGGHRLHGHSSFGIFLGPAFGWPYYSAPAYYPPVIAVPSSPPVYIEQGQGQDASAYWYYCENPQGYYPYIKECPGGWQTVAPEPPPS